MKKKLSNDEKIIKVLDSLDKSTRGLQKYAARYDEYIDAAALRGDDQRAKQLIKQKMGVNALAVQLNALKGNLELGAFNARIMADLGALPEAIGACKGLLDSSPDFSKLSKSIKRIFSDMQRPIDEIQNLNNILEGVLSPNSTNPLISRLDPSEDLEENDEQFKAEYGAMLERISAKVNTNTVVAPKTEENVQTGLFDIEALIAEENKKK